MNRIPGVRALGLDPGSRRIGVAVSDRSGTIASPLCVVQRTRSVADDLAAIARIARDEEADVIVVGHPIGLDGTAGAAATTASRFAHRLGTVVDVPVELHDERLTTVTAERDLMAAGLDAVERRRVVDKVAAAVMLQSWLDTRARRLRSEA